MVYGEETDVRQDVVETCKTRHGQGYGGVE